MLRTLVLFLFLYLISRLLRNIFYPVRAVPGRPNANANGYSGSREGDIKIVDIQAKKETHHSKNDDDGEYIDFKEI